MEGANTPIWADAVSGGSPPEVFRECHTVRLPMVTRFRGITQREALLVRGPAGWAEFSPFLEYDNEESASWLSAALEYSMADSPASTRTSVEVNATVPAVAPHEVAGVLDRFDGARTAKIKVADAGIADLDADLARIIAVHTAAPQLRLRLDANGRYTLPQAKTALAAFADLQLGGVPFVELCEYVEQPVMDVEDLADLREWVQVHDMGLRIAADESIRKASDPLRVAALGAADHIIVKVQPLGGVRRALEVVRATGLSATVSSALDTSVGLSAGTELAALLPPVAAGLGTSSLFTADVTSTPLRARGGVLPVGRVSPERSSLEALRAPDPVHAAWCARLEGAWAVLRTRLDSGAL